MLKKIVLPALGLFSFALAGCAAPNQTYPTTAQTSSVETDMKKPVKVAVPAPLAPGDKVAPFSLPDTAGKSVEVGNWDKSKATVLMFVSTQCPISNDYNARMEKLAKDYGAKGVKFVGINSNIAENSAAIAEHSRENGFSFAVLKDKGNVIADKLNANVTPETYVVNAKGELVYHGQIDNSRNQDKVKTHPLAAALDTVLANQPVKSSDVAAVGCSIKREN